MASVRKFGASLRYEPMPSIPDVFSEVAKAGPITAWCRSKIPLKVRSRTPTICSWTANSRFARKFYYRFVTPDGCFPARGNQKTVFHLQVSPSAVNGPGQYAAGRVVEVSSSTRAAEIARARTSAGALASALPPKIRVNASRQNIQDSSENVTRFLVIGRKSPARTGKTKPQSCLPPKIALARCTIRWMRSKNTKSTSLKSNPARAKRRRGSITSSWISPVTATIRRKKGPGRVAKHTMFVKKLGSYPNVNG